VYLIETYARALEKEQMSMFTSDLNTCSEDDQIPVKRRLELCNGELVIKNLTLILS